MPSALEGVGAGNRLRARLHEVRRSELRSVRESRGAPPFQKKPSPKLPPPPLMPLNGASAANQSSFPSPLNCSALQNDSAPRAMK